MLLSPPSTQHTPTTGGEENLSFSTLTIFCHRLLHLVPPSAQHTPTTGGRGRTYLSHSVYNLYPRSIYTVYTFYIHSIFTVCAQYIMYVLSMHYSHARSRFYRRQIHVHTHLHVQMHPRIKQVHIQHVDTQMLLFPPSTQHTPTTGGEGELIFQHAYYILSSLTTSCSPLHTTYPHHRGGKGTYLSARSLYFVITYYILFALPHNIPPPQGGRGGTMTIGGGRGGWRGWRIYNIHIVTYTIYINLAYASKKESSTAQLFLKGGTSENSLKLFRLYICLISEIFPLSADLSHSHATALMKQKDARSVKRRPCLSQFWHFFSKRIVTVEFFWTFFWTSFSSCQHILPISFPSSTSWRWN